MRLFGYFREHLWVQVLASLSGVFVVVMGAVIAFGILGEHQMITKIVKDQSQMLAESVQGGMHDALAIGDNDSVRQQFIRLKENMPDSDIFVFDFNKQISFATDQSTLGKAVDTLMTSEAAAQATSKMLGDGEMPGEPFEQEMDGKPYLSTLRPIINQSRCYHCHGESRHILGGMMLRLSTDKANNLVSLAYRRNILIGAVGLGIMIFTVYFLFYRLVNRPVRRLTEMTARLRQGDFAHTVQVRGRNELSHISARVNKVAEELGGMLKEIVTNGQTLAAAALQLLSLSREMSSSADQTLGKSNAVASSAEEMSANINAIASASEQMSSNVQGVSSTSEEMSRNVNTVASSIEEMSAALAQVAKNAEEGSDIAGKATDMSHSALNTMNVLGTAATDIGEVTNLIKRIAEQTNLLALNATIEAASAGDAGKGFAVVANEIKELANQSAQAAEDIAKRIQGAQQHTDEAVKVIGDISGIIDKMNETSVVITEAVEQQKTIANEIASNVHQASAGTNSIASSIAEIAKGTDDMAKSAGEAATGVNDVSSNIHEVSQAANDSNAAAQEVSTASNELAKMAGHIRKLVGQFKVME